jgi:hypothetical protein
MRFSLEGGSDYNSQLKKKRETKKKKKKKRGDMMREEVR